MEYLLTDLKMLVLERLDAKYIINFLRCNTSLYSLLDNDVASYCGSRIEDAERDRQWSLFGADFTLRLVVIDVCVGSTSLRSFGNNKVLADFTRAYNHRLDLCLRDSTPADFSPALVILLRKAKGEAFFQRRDNAIFGVSFDFSFDEDSDLYEDF